MSAAMGPLTARHLRLGPALISLARKLGHAHSMRLRRCGARPQRSSHSLRSWRLSSRPGSLSP
eukprot:2287445-Pyramimonas_sp.AAC.1